MLLFIIAALVGVLVFQTRQINKHLTTIQRLLEPERAVSLGLKPGPPLEQ